MREIESPSKIYVAESKIPDAGKGVFAKEPIAKGEVIENCPVIEVSLGDPANNDEGTLVNYFFYFGNVLALALGFGSLYNHSYDPNATYKPNLEDKTIDYTAIKDIDIGEEITVNYNYGNPEDKSTPTVKGIPPFKESN
jgi:uncharacterized protein